VRDAPKIATITINCGDDKIALILKFAIVKGYIMQYMQLIYYFQGNRDGFKSRGAGLISE